MDREILFRGKRIDNGEWIEGYSFKIWDKCYILWGTTNEIPNMIEVLPETVCEWTGLTDKKGRRIFEGDIVRYPCGAEYEVFYDSETMSFRLKNETDIHCFEIEANLDMEVIGTIFDKEDIVNKEQQIKKLAEEIYRAGVALDGSDFAHKSDHFERLAGELYNAGYRKQSETVKEFAEKLKQAMAQFNYFYCGSNGIEYYGEIGVNDFSKMLNELAEQYGKGGRE